MSFWDEVYKLRGDSIITARVEASSSAASPIREV